MTETNEKTLVWMDLEMTGLDPELDTIIEIATIITDNALNIIAEGPNLVIHEPASRYQQMDAWNQAQHKKSGLWEKVISSSISLSEAEQQTLEFLKKYVSPKSSPLAGNSVWQDRRFLLKYMPTLEAHLHYRLVDVSAIKELASRWYPEKSFKKNKNLHRALDDIKESIEELKFYKENFFIPSK